MANAVARVALYPLLTGPLLLLLRSHYPLLVAMRNFPSHPRIIALLSYLQRPRVITALKWLFALGLLSRVNRFLHIYAMNNWKVDTGSRSWIWDREIAVVTGGSSGTADILNFGKSKLTQFAGIGFELVKKLAAAEIKVAVIDVTPLPPALKSCR